MCQAGVAEWLRALCTIGHEFEYHQCGGYVCKYMGRKALAAMLTYVQLAGVALEGNLAGR